MFDNSGQIAGWSGADAGVSRALVKMEDYLLMTAMSCPSYVCILRILLCVLYGKTGGICKFAFGGLTSST